MAIDELLRYEDVLIIVIDNPHLCLGQRIAAKLDRLLGMLRSRQVTVCGLLPAGVGGLAQPGVEVINVVPRGPVEDETEFIDSFKRFAAVPLLRQIRLPISGLDLFDAVGYDGLIYPYRVSAELDWSGLARLRPPYDAVVILGGSHFNYPLPERILGEMRRAGPSAGRPAVIGLPVGPATGPLSPHWCALCDVVFARDVRTQAALIQNGAAGRVEVSAEPSEGIPAARPPRTCPPEGPIEVFIDWTFLHTWQLKVVLEELAESDLRSRLVLHLAAASEETARMLWAKWGTLLEKFGLNWVYVNTGAYSELAGSADLAVGFVGGRDVWVWRDGERGIIICDFAGWWQPFGFEGPAPAASPREFMASFKTQVAAWGRGPR